LSKTKKERKIATFSKVMTPKEAEDEKQKGSSLGKSLKKADEQYEERRRST